MINFFFFLAEQVREYMAQLGFRQWTRWSAAWTCWNTSPPSITGRRRGIDLSAILYNPPLPARVARRCIQAQDHGLDQALDHQSDPGGQACPRKAEAGGGQRSPIRNVNRSVGTMLSGDIARRFGSQRACPMTPFATISMDPRARASAHSWPTE